MVNNFLGLWHIVRDCILYVHWLRPCQLNSTVLSFQVNQRVTKNKTHVIIYQIYPEGIHPVMRLNDGPTSYHLSVPDEMSAEYLAGWLCKWILWLCVLILRNIEKRSCDSWLLDCFFMCFICETDDRSSCSCWQTRRILFLLQEKPLISELRLIERKFSSWSMTIWLMPASRNWPVITDCCFYCFSTLVYFFSVYNYQIFPVCLTKEGFFILFTFWLSCYNHLLHLSASEVSDPKPQAFRGKYDQIGLPLS